LIALIISAHARAQISEARYQNLEGLMEN
jgi:hypothetical protein